MIEWLVGVGVEKGSNIYHKRYEWISECVACLLVGGLGFGAWDARDEGVSVEEYWR